MKRAIAVVLIAAITLSGCAKSKVINGKEYQPYGLATLNREDPAIEYEMSFGSCFFGIFFFETIVAPIYVIGWNIMQPVGPKLNKAQAASERST